jgi:phospholipid/cholesterol/gamma-HCH transport system ATP-binding protein
MIVFDNVHKTFGTNAVLRGVSFMALPGRVHFVMGMSGAGKSVTIKSIIGLIRPDKGRIFVDGREVTGLTEDELTPVRAQCQYIFQHATLFDHLTVLENVAMPVGKRFRLPLRDAKARAEAALEKVHAQNLLTRLPPELGKGSQKRVAIARALALEPSAILYDEPTTGLDPVAARRIDALIDEMSQVTGLVSMVVSHDLTSAKDIASHVSFLHEGRIRYDGSADGLFASDDEVLHSFMHPRGAATDAAY